MAGTIVRRHSPLRVAGVGCDRCGGDTRNSGSDDMLDATDDPQAEASDMTERCGRWHVLPGLGAVGTLEDPGCERASVDMPTVWVVWRNQYRRDPRVKQPLALAQPG
jgi:hypothetical protein